MSEEEEEEEEEERNKETKKKKNISWYRCQVRETVEKSRNGARV
jgi:hypothetical protein